MSRNRPPPTLKELHRTPDQSRDSVEVACVCTIFEHMSFDNENTNTTCVTTSALKSIHPLQLQGEHNLF